MALQFAQPDDIPPDHPSGKNVIAALVTGKIQTPFRRAAERRPQKRRPRETENPNSQPKLSTLSHVIEDDVTLFTSADTDWAFRRLQRS